MVKIIQQCLYLIGAHYGEVIHVYYKMVGHSMQKSCLVRTEKNYSNRTTVWCIIMVTHVSG